MIPLKPTQDFPDALRTPYDSGNSREMTTRSVWYWPTYPTRICRWSSSRRRCNRLGKLDGTADRAETLTDLDWLLHGDGQLDAADGAASRAIDLPPPDGEQLRVCRCHRVLGYIFDSKGETEKDVHHLEIALRIASATCPLSCFGFISSRRRCFS